MALERAGKREQTLLVFFSDNGGYPTARNDDPQYPNSDKYTAGPAGGFNMPLRGKKTELYEGGIRVPAFVSWPERLPPAVVEQTISYLDWLPTMAHWAGVRPEAGWKLEGREIGPLLAGADRKPAEPTLYWNIDYATAVLHGDWKLIVSQWPSATVELYNLAEDPKEAKNLADTNPAKVQELRQILAEQKSLDP